MAQTLTFGSTIWRFFINSPVRLSIRLDHGVPGAHLIWDIENASEQPIVVAKLIVRGRRGNVDVVPLGFPHVMSPDDRLVVPTDVDWAVVNAKSLAVADTEGREYPVPARQLAAVHSQLHEDLGRAPVGLSARDFLFGATDLAFGVAILGLGVFMLLWVIATG